MPLTPGTRLGSYEVLAAIGAGGMGEVYRARDGTLHRDVALKVLPNQFALDTDRLARFRREAQVLAALNHPNIAAIYGLEESTSVHALVLELVEGPTLADRLAQGAMPLDEVLPIARQIAEALEAAHEQGIIHRDLKPANIKLRPDGTVKVLDFGLAKALAPATGPVNATTSPTITSPAMMTGLGMILGTAAYMSPEQARGKPVDKRADIWAFGCVLFEMLTATRAFEDEDVSLTLSKVLQRDPDFDAIPPDVPARVRQALRVCLQKNLQTRAGDIHDVRLAMDGAFETVDHRNQGLGLSRLPWWRRALPTAAVFVLTAVLVGGLTWRLRPPSDSSAPVAQFSIGLPEGSALGGLGRQVVAISADGTRLAFVTNEGVYVRTLGAVDAFRVPGLEGGNSTAFSPDGESIVLHTLADSTLKRIPTRGGQPLTIASDVLAPSGLSWGEGGILFGQAENGVFRVSPNGGMPERLASVGAGEVAYGPQMLPGGDAVMFTVAKSAGADRWDTAQIVVQSLTSDERRVIINGGSDARYLPTGHIIYAVAGTIFAQAFDPRTRIVRGEAMAVLAGVMRSLAGTTAVSHLSVSDNGSLFYVPGPMAPSNGGGPRIPTLLSRDGKPERLALPPRSYIRPRVSPDGRRLVVGIEEGSDADVWVFDFSGATALRRLTFGGHNRFPVWSADGQRVAFQSDRDGTASIYVQLADGGSAAERLTTAEQGASHIPDSWSPDGHTLLFSDQKGTTYSLTALSVAEKRAVGFGGVRSSEPLHAVFSPDGRWVAYSFNEGAVGARSADRGIFVQPVPATGATYQVPKTRLDFHPTWAPSGREIFYVPTTLADDLVGVSVQAQPSLTFGLPSPVVNVTEPGIISTQPRGYDVLPDGRFLMMLPVEDAVNAGGSSEMRLILNWFEELKRLVPVN